MLSGIYQYSLNADTYITVRHAESRDAPRLASRLRTADLREIQSHVAEDPSAHIERSIIHSNPCYTIWDYNGTPIAVFGVIPDSREDGVGKIWMLASSILASHRYVFLKHSKEWIERLHQRYQVLWNYVDARNDMHIRWLKWCGFSFVRLIDEHGVDRLPFWEFEKVRWPKNKARSDCQRPEFNTLNYR
jgi:hypothetical protein